MMSPDQKDRIAAQASLLEHAVESGATPAAAAVAHDVDTLLIQHPYSTHKPMQMHLAELPANGQLRLTLLMPVPADLVPSLPGDFRAQLSALIGDGEFDVRIEQDGTPARRRRVPASGLVTPVDLDVSVGAGAVTVAFSFVREDGDDDFAKGASAEAFPEGRKLHIVPHVEAPPAINFGKPPRDPHFAPQITYSSAAARVRFEGRAQPRTDAIAEKVLAALKNGELSAAEIGGLIEEYGRAAGAPTFTWQAEVFTELARRREAGVLTIAELEVALADLPVAGDMEHVYLWSNAGGVLRYQWQTALADLSRQCPEARWDPLASGVPMTLAAWSAYQEIANISAAGDVSRGLQAARDFVRRFPQAPQTETFKRWIARRI